MGQLSVFNGPVECVVLGGWVRWSDRYHGKRSFGVLQIVLCNVHGGEGFGSGQVLR